MVAVHTISWEEAMSPDFGTPARQAWRAAVQTVAERAKQTLPSCGSRVDRAVAIVLNHDVELLDDGKARVCSQSNGQVVYHVVNGECPCKDYAKAPSNWYKHRIAAGLYKRAQALVQRQLAQSNGASNGQVAAAPDPAPAPAPAEVRVPEQAEAPQGVPAQDVVLIQGKPFVKFTGLLQMAHDRGLVALTADWTYNDGDLSLAHAVATFQDGRRFEESGDASPGNVTRLVAVHFRRVALTRAKARVLCAVQAA